MPYAKVTLTPGFNVQATQTLNASGYSLGNLVRWRYGMIEKMAGWAQIFSGAAAGIIRAMHAYEDLDLNLNLLLGTDAGAQILINDNGVQNLYTFGLLRRLAGINPFTFVSATVSLASTLVTVTDTGNGVSQGDTVTFPITWSIGGRIILGGSSFTVANIVDANNWQFNMPLPSTSTANGRVPQLTTTAHSTSVGVSLPAHGLSPGNSFVLQYTTILSSGSTTFTIPAGTVTVVTATTNTFTFNVPHAPTFGTNALEGANNPAGTTPDQFLIQYTGSPPSSPQNWFVDNLGNNGLVSFTNGPIYVYTPPISPTSPTLTNAGTGSAGSPQINAGIFVAMPQAQVIAFGSEAVIGAGVQDPLLVRWSDAGSYTVWIATATNQAGSFHLSRGSKIVGGIQAPQSTLLWTDIDVWSMAYIGFPLVYDFTVIGTGCGLISPLARCIQGRNTYWMGQNSFWTFGDSGVQQLECPLWDQVFPMIDPANSQKCFGASNSSATEIMFFYPVIGGNGECTNYVKYHTVEGFWDYGTLTRTSWIDESVLGFPLGSDLSLLIQQHEIGYDANGQAMAGAFYETGYIEAGDGTYILYIDNIIPDFKWLGSGGYVQITIWGANTPGGSAKMYGPFPVTQTTGTIATGGIRHRLVAMRVDLGLAKGFNARLGAVSIRSKPAGRVP